MKKTKVVAHLRKEGWTAMCGTESDTALIMDFECWVKDPNRCMRCEVKVVENLGPDWEKKGEAKMEAAVQTSEKKVRLTATTKAMGRVTRLTHRPYTHVAVRQEPIFSFDEKKKLHTYVTWHMTAASARKPSGKNNSIIEIVEVAR